MVTVSSGVFRLSKLADRICLSANGTRQFCRIVRPSHSQIVHTWRARSIRIKTALSSAWLMRFISRLASSDKYWWPFFSSACYSDKNVFTKRWSFKRNRKKIEPMRFSLLRFSQLWLWWWLRFSILTEPRGPLTRNENCLQTREQLRIQGAIGWGFAADWLEKWREIFMPITERSSSEAHEA